MFIKLLKSLLRRKLKKKKEEKMKQAEEVQVESMAGKQTPETPEEGYVSSATEKDCNIYVSSFPTLLLGRLLYIHFHLRIKSPIKHRPRRNQRLLRLPNHQTQKLS